MKMTKLQLLVLIAIVAHVAQARTPIQGTPSRRGSTLVPHYVNDDRCILSDDREGHCVESYLCKNSALVTDGSDLTDERTIQCVLPKICCFLSDHEPTKAPILKHSTLVPGIPKVPTGPGSPCFAADDSSGRCVYPHLCSNTTAIVDGSDFLDERTVDPCPDWRDATQICCPASLLLGKIDLDNDGTKETSTASTALGARGGKGGKEVESCTTRYSSLGQCVYFYQCTNKQFDEDNIINVSRFEAERSCPYSKTCCPVENVDTTKQPSTPSPNLACGKANKNGVVYKDVQGRTNEAKYGEFPWMVAVKTRRSPTGDNYNISGGSIIHPWVVLTAAHYVVRAVGSDVKVRAGEWDILSVDEPLEYQERAISKILAHPDFKNSNKHNDIALLFLTTPFELAPHVGVVCLPPEGVRAQPTTDCTANGWGKDKFGKKGVTQHILKRTILPVMARDECQNRLRNTRLGPFYKLHEGFMCAGGERLDTCTQDGGGPLACPVTDDSDVYVLYGIVSWGIGCGQDGIPGVYMDVSQYIPWIKREANLEGYRFDKYSL